MIKNKPATIEVVGHLCELVMYLPAPTNSDHAALMALHELLKTPRRAFSTILHAFDADSGPEFVQGLKENRPEAWLIEGCLRLLEASVKEAKNG